MVTELMIRGPQIIPRHDNRHDAQIFPCLGGHQCATPVLAICVTSLQASRYRHYLSREISRLFAEFVALFSLVTTGQLEEEESALGRKAAEAAGAAFGWRRYLQGAQKKKILFC